MEVGLGPGDFVLDSDSTPLPKKRRSPPIFGPFLLWPNGWMPLGVEVGLGLGDLVLDGDQAPPLQKGGRAFPQISAHVHCG